MSRRSRPELPIRGYKKKIIETLKDNRVIVVIGHTGCGKSTQLPQMLYEEGYGTHKVIACTQPRRFAAYSLAKRVASEMNCRLGSIVGYKYRFEDVTNERTRILYMTDGSLLMNRINSVTLSRYSVIMLDEVHERALQTDLLFGLLKETIVEREDLRVIITSATLEADTFSKYFFNAPVIEVSGSMYEVEVLYKEIPPRNKFVADVIKALDSEQDEGDVLVFLAGKPEIEEVHSCLRTETSLHVLPAHAELPTHELDRIHEDAPEGRRKVVLATNVAETSLTVEGIVFVVDQGYVKLNFYDGPSDTNELKRVRCSQAEAQQRKGRAGRTKPGVCYRLYSEYTFNKEMPKLRPPEVSRANLTAMTLQLKSVGYTDVLVFSFLTAPNMKNLKVAHDHLHQFGALDQDCLLTRKGRLMTKFPLEPKLACCLIEGSDIGCAEEILKISSMLCGFNEGQIRKLSPILTNNCDLRDELLSDEGELFALENIFRKYLNHRNRDAYMEKYQFNRTVMKEASEVYKQMKGIMKREHLPVQSCHKDNELVLTALVSGLFHCLSVHESPPLYRVVRDQKVAKMSPHLLTEMAVTQKILLGTYLSKPSERNDRVMSCITVMPSDMDLTEFVQKFQTTCKHFGRTRENEPEPFWMTEVKEWHDKYLKSQKENVSLQKDLRQRNAETSSWQSQALQYRDAKVRLETQNAMNERRISELTRENSQLRREKAAAQDNVSSYDFVSQRRISELTREKDRLIRENSQLRAEKAAAQDKCVVM